jgi:DNA-binding transcriptional MerR regulator
MKVDKTKDGMTIGELVKRLKKIYPDISQSKLRFLESRGLITPKRSANSYRLFNKEDVIRLNFILKMQKDFYMPLDVIKEKLKHLDFKNIDINKDVIDQLKMDLSVDENILKDTKTTLEEIKQKFHIEKDFIMEMADNELISIQESGYTFSLDSQDVEILKIAFELSKYGIHVKHLKLFENYANRQSSFIQQIVLPLLLSSSQESHKKAVQYFLKLEEAICSLNNLFVKRENKLFIDKYR